MLVSFVHFTEIFGKGQLMDIGRTDIVIHKWLPNPDMHDFSISLRKSPFIIYRMARTLIIDLKKGETEIFNDIHKNTRAKINRASREGFTYLIKNTPTDQEIEEFTIFFNQFAKTKKIRHCQPGRLKALRNRNAFIITMIKRENVILCYHGYILDGERAIMLYSASDRIDMGSSNRNEIGRANRYLHWKSILSFKENGCKWYDFCGLSLDDTDKAAQGINHFKRGFGGCEVDEIKVYEGKSLFGKLVLTLCRFIWRSEPEYLRAKKLINTKAKNYE
jgi:lipid II:glycine glycyltransferase (peptidoglycan interpeptide bridge formation enzyme)